MDSASFYNEIARKWQEEWERRKLFYADPSTKEKFFITVAFPYTNSPLHIGHGRTYVTADILARYYRMKGKNVLFPFAFQFTGTPILSISEAIRRGDKDIVSDFRNLYNIPEDKIAEFQDPFKLAEYFRDDMKRMAKTLGLSVDWRREFTTVDPRFEKLVQWQFRKLKEKGYIVTSTDAVGYCPNDNFPVGMHDTKGDVEPEIQDMDVVEFEGSDLVFPSATTRPETVFGATAILIDPSATYVIVKGRKWVVSKEAFRKLSYQIDIAPESEVAGRELVGKTARNPLTGREVRVVGTKYVDPRVGTGVVMAVPAHEPLHYLALSEVMEEVEVVPVISTEGYGDFPGPEVLSLAGTKNPAELKDYVDTLYREEYYKGIIRTDVVDLVPDYMKAYLKEKVVGKRVPDARKEVVNLLKSLGKYDNIYEIANGPVYCRCGTEVVVKVIRDQWYIAYDNPIWKSWTMKTLDSINVVPREAKRDLERAIFSMRKRACSRSRGLGVRLPWDPNQIIDSLSDSTIYTAFYTVVHRLNYEPERLNDSFWNYVLLGDGEPRKVSEETGIPEQELRSLREEFVYWYPLDSRHSGRDLIQNHLPYLLYNHLAVFGESYLPRMLVINGFVRVGGKKMSKSFRNIYPLAKAVEEYGVDPVRLSLTVSSALSEDTDFNVNSVKAVSEQLRRMFDLASNVAKLKEEWDNQLPEKWLSSVFHLKIKAIRDLMEEVNLRDAFNTILFELYEIVRDYLSMVNKPNARLLKKVINAWARLIAPGAPHVAEEIWHMFNDSFISTENYPSPDEFEFDGNSVIQVEYIRHVIRQVKELASLTNKEPEKVILYVASAEDMGIFRSLVRAIKERRSIRDVSSATGVNESYLRSLLERVQGVPEILRDLIVSYPLDEFKTITDNLGFMMRKLDVDEIQVYRADEPTAPDPRGKKGNAFPLLPGIVIL